MDPALLKDRELFKKRAMAVPVVEKRKAKESDKAKPSKKPKTSTERPQPKEFDYKKATGSSQYKFSILAKIVKHMKTRHQESHAFPLTIDEILDETKQLDVNARIKHWLETEALNSNEKIEVVDGDRYKYKPKYGFKNRKTLLNFLEKQDRNGRGGLLLEDIEEAVPNSAKALKVLGDQIIIIERPTDKKKVVFFNDKSVDFTVSEDLQKLWRQATVDIDEKKIEEYLQKHGIASMQNATAKVVAPQKRKQSNKKKNRQFKTHNDHLSGVLEDYSETQK